MENEIFEKAPVPKAFFYDGTPCSVQYGNLTGL